MIIPKLNLILPIIVPMNSAYLLYEDHEQYLKLISQGEWTIKTVPQIEKLLQKIPTNRKIIWDVTALYRVSGAFPKAYRGQSGRLHA